MALVAVAVVSFAALALVQMYGKPVTRNYSYEYYLLKREAATAAPVQIPASPGECPEPGADQVVVYVYRGRTIGFAVNLSRGDVQYYFYLCLIADAPVITARGERGHLYYAYVKHGLDPLPALSVTDRLGRMLTYALVAKLDQDGSLAVPVLVVLAPGDGGFCVYDYPFGGCILDNTQDNPPVS